MSKRQTHREGVAGGAKLWIPPWRDRQTAELFLFGGSFYKEVSFRNTMQINTVTTIDPIQDYLRGDIVYESKVV